MLQTMLYVLNLLLYNWLCSFSLSCERVWGLGFELENVQHKKRRVSSLVDVIPIAVTPGIQHHCQLPANLPHWQWLRPEEANRTIWLFAGVAWVYHSGPSAAGSLNGVDRTVTVCSMVIQVGMLGGVLWHASSADTNRTAWTRTRSGRLRCRPALLAINPTIHSQVHHFSSRKSMIMMPQCAHLSNKSNHAETWDDHRHSSAFYSYCSMRAFWRWRKHWQVGWFYAADNSIDEIDPLPERLPAHADRSEADKLRIMILTTPQGR